MAAASWPETIRVIMKLGLEDRIQETPKHLLSDSISDCRNSERTKLGGFGIFRDVDSSSGERPERSVLQFPHESAQISLQVLFEHLNAHLVDACGTPISAYRSPRLVHQLGSNPPREAMDFLLAFAHDTCMLILWIAQSSERTQPEYLKVFLSLVGLPERGAGSPLVWLRNRRANFLRVSRGFSLLSQRFFLSSCDYTGRAAILSRSGSGSLPLHRINLAFRL